MGYLIKMCGAPISWTAKFQKGLAQSSTEAEYLGLTMAAKQAIHIKAVCDELSGLFWYSRGEVETEKDK